MIYLFLGEDSVSKDAQIDQFKKKTLNNETAVQFDFEVLHAFKLPAAVFKEKLYSLPAIAKKRLMVVRECHRLDAQNKEILFEFIRQPEAPCVLILDSQELTTDDSFVKKLGHDVKIMPFGLVEALDVFDLTKAIQQRKEVDALKILSELITHGDHPLQIMGGLVWFWGRCRDRIPIRKFQDGLAALEEADLNIKRSRLDAQYALEVLIVKLCSEGA